jgi:Fe-Mn family superoxide dismutase
LQLKQSIPAFSFITKEKIMNTDRRDFLKIAAILSAGAATQISKAETLLGIQGVTGAFELPPLGYAYDALEPFIDAQTMQLHHDKHHQAYITKLNEAIDKEPSLKGKTLEELLSGLNTVPESVRMAVRNHGGGHWNHSFFWQLLKKGTQPGEKATAAITAGFGSMENFKKEFEKAAMGTFGSGWAWLIHSNGKLAVTTTPNQDNPLMEHAAKKGKPVIGIDVWEHAYYLKYQNKRADYVQAFWNVLNWEQVEALLKA